MVIEFDPAKNTINLRKHGVSLQAAEDLDLSSAAIRVDDRENYGELRYQAIGFIGSILYTFVFAMNDEVVRAISLRKATGKEAMRYAQEF